MELDLNELERRAKAATPGKWTWKQVGSFNTPGCAIFWPDASKGGTHYRRLDSGGGMLEADADFIAAAHPAVVLELVRRLREAEKDAARYRRVRRGQKWSVIDGIGNNLRGGDLDAAIDSAMQPPKGEPQK